MKLRPAIFCVLFVMLAASGCLFSPDEGGGGGEDPVDDHVFPDTADKLVANFDRYYSERNLERYREVLSDDYRFIAQDGSEYNFDREIDVANKMFNEIEGQDGIAFSDITVEYLQPQGTWQPTPEDDPYFGGFSGSLKRPYDVFISFKVSGQALTYEVKGLVVFYVTKREVEVDGAMVDMYELLGQQDETQGGGKALALN
ncbi:hypothetical protein GF314_16520 [bacterium]|nr:hypothetical protein [bacterium]